MSNACRVAQLYDRAVVDLWKGDGDLMRRVADWLGATWNDGPPEPATPPASVSPHGGGGRSIRWYDTETEVLGYVPGRTGCYRLPIETIGCWAEGAPAPQPAPAPPPRLPAARPLRLAS